MKILHITPTYIPAWRYGGPIRSVHALCKGLVLNGEDVSVYTTSVDGPDQLSVPIGEPVIIDGVKVSYFKSNLFRRIFWSPAMKEALEKNILSYDLVHIHSLFLWPVVKAATIASRQGIPYVVSPRGMLNKRLFRRKNYLVKMGWYYLFGHKMINCAAIIHATSKIESESMQEYGISENKIRVIPNAIDSAMMAQRASLTSERKFIEIAEKSQPYVLFLGRINWKKGLHCLVSAMESLDGLNLLVVGNDEEGHWEEIKTTVQKLQIEKRVHYLGPIYDDAVKEKLYKAAVAFVLPSHSENFGMAVLEAMAAGCLVILTPDVGLAAEIKERGCGVVVERTPKKLRNAIVRVWKNCSERDLMGNNALNYAKAFTPNEIGGKMKNVYIEAITERAKKNP